MGRHGWIAHTIARMLDLIRFRAGRFIASVPGRIPGIDREPPRTPAPLVATPAPSRAAHHWSSEYASDLPAEFPGAERFEEPVAVDVPSAVSPSGGVPTRADVGDGDDVDASGGAGWSDDELLTFTPDASLDLVDEIEFSFEPEPHLGESGSGTGTDGEQGALVGANGGAETGLGWVEGDGTRQCPETFPIKGNGNSHIYHLPGQSSYSATIPELCFATEDAAAAEGYRPVKRSQAAH